MDETKQQLPQSGYDLHTIGGFVSYNMLLKSSHRSLMLKSMVNLISCPVSNNIIIDSV